MFLFSSLVVVFCCYGLILALLVLKERLLRFLGVEGFFPFKVTFRKLFFLKLSLEEFRWLAVEWARFAPPRVILFGRGPDGAIGVGLSR